MESTGQAQLMESELNRAEEEYLAARSKHQRTKLELELAREKFRSVKDLAKDILSDEDFFAWTTKHLRTRFTAISIGDAIVQALRLYTSSCAKESMNLSVREFCPSAPLQQIVRWLEEGGYEFQSATPGREANAALMRLSDVEKTPEGEYVLKKAGLMLERVKLMRMTTKKEK